MNAEDYTDKLKEAIQICEIHNQRMRYAIEKVKHHFPLDEGKYQNLSFDDLSYLDQLIFRFSKLQDGMGTRLFPATLENWGEGPYVREGAEKRVFRLEIALQYTFHKGSRPGRKRIH